MEWSNDPLEDIIKLLTDKKKEILVVGAAVVALSGAFFGYRYYRVQYEENAYKALTEALEYFNAPIKEKDAEEEFDFVDKKEFATEQLKWEKVASVFKNAYDSFSRAGIAPLFLVYQAEGLVGLGKKQEAISLLEQAIGFFENEDVAEYYRVKRALLQIDADDETVKQTGIATLKSIAAHDKSVAHDMALYRLGEYYWYTKNFEEARNYWNQLILVAKYNKDAQYSSQWAQKAREKLQLIDANVE